MEDLQAAGAGWRFRLELGQFRFSKGRRQGGRLSAGGGGSCQTLPSRQLERLGLCQHHHCQDLSINVLTRSGGGE